MDNPLSPIQREVLAAMFRGDTIKQIAASRGVCRQTVNDAARLGMTKIARATGCRCSYVPALFASVLRGWL